MGADSRKCPESRGQHYRAKLDAQAQKHRFLSVDFTVPCLATPTYPFGETRIISGYGLAQIIFQDLFQAMNSDSLPSRGDSRGSRTRGKR